MEKRSRNKGDFISHNYRQPNTSLTFERKTLEHQLDIQNVFKTSFPSHISSQILLLVTQIRPLCLLEAKLTPNLCTSQQCYLRRRFVSTWNVHQTFISRTSFFFFVSVSFLVRSSSSNEDHKHHLKNNVTMLHTNHHRKDITH